jgi:hypothetical protein
MPRNVGAPVIIPPEVLIVPPVVKEPVVPPVTSVDDAIRKIAGIVDPPAEKIKPPVKKPASKAKK